MHSYTHTHTVWYRYTGISRGETLATIEQWREMRALEAERIRRVDLINKIKHPDEPDYMEDPDVEHEKRRKWPRAVIPSMLGLDDKDDGDDTGPLQGKAYT